MGSVFRVTVRVRTSHGSRCPGGGQMACVRGEPSAVVWTDLRTGWTSERALPPGAAGVRRRVSTHASGFNVSFQQSKMYYGRIVIAAALKTL